VTAPKEQGQGQATCWTADPALYHSEAPTVLPQERKKKSIFLHIFYDVALRDTGFIFAYLLLDLRAENGLHCGDADGCKTSRLPEALRKRVSAIVRKAVQDRDAADGDRSDCWTSCWWTETRGIPAAVAPISRGSCDNNTDEHINTRRSYGNNVKWQINSQDVLRQKREINQGPRAQTNKHPGVPWQ
jgi:hypothetical protein